MSVVRAAPAIAALVLAACVSPGQPALEVRIFNDELRQAWGDHAGTMSAQRAPLTLPSGATIATCGEYLERAGGIDREQPDQMLGLQDYVICDSLALLQRAQPVALASIDAGQALATRLDFRTFPSSVGPRVSSQAFSLAALASEPLAIERHAATLDSGDWYLRLEQVAAADFNGDGQEDWLVWIGDDSKVGTYQTFNVLLVYDVSAIGTLTGEPVR